MPRIYFLYICLALSLIWTAGADSGAACKLKENGKEINMAKGEQYFSNTLCKHCICHPSEGLQCSTLKPDNCNMADAVTGK